MQFARDPNRNPFKGSTLFSRRITIIQARVQLCDEFWSVDRGDRGDRESRFWIASSDEVIHDGFFFSMQIACICDI
jgi:hypothetical protein